MSDVEVAPVITMSNDHPPRDDLEEMSASGQLRDAEEIADPCLICSRVYGMDISGYNAVTTDSSNMVGVGHNRSHDPVHRSTTYSGL